MIVELASAAHGPWGDGPWGDGGPGWWIAFPVLFWVILLSIVGWILVRSSPRRSARRAAERVLAERYARGEIDMEEWQRRRDGLRAR